MIKIPVYENTKGLIFDCDGTLVDSMPVHMEAWENTLKNLKAFYDYDLFFSARGMKEKDIVNLYNKKYHTTWDPSKIVEAKHDYFRKHLSNIKPIQPVVDIVKEYLSLLPMAVVSGGTKEIITAELNAINILNHFKVVLTADDLFKPKPAPDLFIEAARILDISYNECQVFEDADLGIEAAKNAGMMITDVRQYI